MGSGIVQISPAVAAHTVGVRPGKGGKTFREVYSTAYKAVRKEATGTRSNVTPDADKGSTKQHELTGVRGFHIHTYDLTNYALDIAYGDPSERLVSDIESNITDDRANDIRAMLTGLTANATADVTPSGGAADLIFDGTARAFGRTNFFKARVVKGAYGAKMKPIATMMNSVKWSELQATDKNGLIRPSQNGEFETLFNAQNRIILEDTLDDDTVVLIYGPMFNMGFGGVQLVNKVDEGDDNGWGGSEVNARNVDAAMMFGHNYEGSGAYNDTAFALANSWSLGTDISPKNIPIVICKDNGTADITV